MKRISFYLFVIVFLGGLFVGFWAWQKYVKTSEPKVLQFAAELGDLRELVKVRGEVAAQKEGAVGSAGRPFNVTGDHPANHRA